MIEKHTPLRSLLKELRNAPHGAIEGHAKYKVMHLLANCWHELEGAEHATRAAPAKRPQAEIKALRAAEDAVDRLSRIGDILALKQAHKPPKSEATWIEPKPPAPSVAPVPKPVKLVVRKTHPWPLQKRKLSEAEVQAIVERAISRSEERR